MILFDQFEREILWYLRTLIAEHQKHWENKLEEQPARWNRGAVEEPCRGCEVLKHVVKGMTVMLSKTNYYNVRICDRKKKEPAA